MRVKSIFLVSLALIVAVIDLMQIAGWVALSWIQTDGVLDGIITKLQFSMFCVKRAIDRLYLYDYFNFRLEMVCINSLIPFGWVILRKCRSAMALSHYYTLFVF